MIEATEPAPTASQLDPVGPAAAPHRAGGRWVAVLCLAVLLAVGCLGLLGRPLPGGPFVWMLAGAALALRGWSAARADVAPPPAPRPAAEVETRVGGTDPTPTPLPGDLNLAEESRQSRKLEAVGRLAGGVAHDFNNILTVINGCSDLLLEMLPPGQPGREMLEEIRKAGERATGLTRQLLAFSRKQVLQPRPVDLNELVRGMDTMLRRLVREDILLVWNLHPAPLTVEVDPGQIEQVLMNLVINARDAMPSAGTITIATGRTDETAAGASALLKVTDTGTGMDPATKSRIFEPFFTTKENGKGTGLGLAMVYGIIEQSGGTIEVSSAVGRGTTFRIRLPLSEKAAVEDAAAGPRPPSDTGGTETILLVEDEDGVRALARRALQAQGYQVLEARNGMEALVRSRKHRGKIDLVLTDVVMPHLGGAELVPILKRRHPGIKIIFMSGYTESVVVHQGVSIHEAKYLDKPFTAEQLTGLVRQALDEAPVDAAAG